MQLENSKIPSPAPNLNHYSMRKWHVCESPVRTISFPGYHREPSHPFGIWIQQETMRYLIFSWYKYYRAGFVSLRRPFWIFMRGLRGLEPKLRKWLGAWSYMEIASHFIILGERSDPPRIRQFFPPVSDFLNFLVPDLVPVDHVFKIQKQFHSKRMWGLTVGFLGFGIWNTLWTKLSWSRFRARAILALHNKNGSLLCLRRTSLSLQEDVLPEK